MSGDNIINEIPSAGDCYESSFKNALGFQQLKETVEQGKGTDEEKAQYKEHGLNHEISIVHGWVTPRGGPAAGKRMHHAWFEIGNVVFESQGGTARRYRKQEYYDLFGVSPNQYYSVQEAMTFVTAKPGLQDYCAWRGKGTDGMAPDATPLQQARREWEEKTVACPKTHYIGRTPYQEDFRRFGAAIAWLEWDDDFIQIAKIETLQPGQGAATNLIEFLKTLADKYYVRLFGNAVVYPPDAPAPEGNLFSQAQLECWYKKHGFQLRKIGDTGLTAIWYPDAPPTPDEPPTR